MNNTSRLNELDKSMNKYCDLLANILNLQESKQKTDNENQTQIQKQKQKLQQFKLPVRHQSFQNKSSKVKPTTKPLMNNTAKTFTFGKAVKNVALPLVTKKSKPVPSSKLNKSIEALNNIKSLSSSSSSSSLSKLSKSKSAENLNQKNLNSILKKNQAINDLDISNELLEKILNLAKNFDNLNEINFEKFLELLNKNIKIKTENRKPFLENLIELVKKYHDTPTPPPTPKEPTPTTSDETTIQLEIKLESMKNEIEKLKQKLNATTSLTSNGKSTTSQNVFQSFDANLISKDLNENLNQIVSSYSDKLAQMQNQIFDLTALNDSLITEKNTHNEFESIKVNQEKYKTFLNESNLTAIENKNSFEKLKNELKDSNEKCKVLEYLLNQKGKENEYFVDLFKEISQSISSLIYELEKSGRQVNSRQDNSCVTETIKDTLIKFQKRLGNTANQVAKTTPIQSTTHQTRETQLYPLVNKTSNQRNLESSKNNFYNQIMPNSGFNQLANPNNKTNNLLELNLNDISTTTSSDTLVDADSSFDLNLNLFRQSTNNNNNNNNNKKSSNHFYPVSTNKNILPFSLLNNQELNFDQDSQDDEEENDNEQRILMAMEELNISVSTMQSSTSQTSQAKSNESIANLNMKDEDQFQEGLKMLDQKIFKVKKLLESMKNT